MRLPSEEFSGKTALNIMRPFSDAEIERACNYLHKYNSNAYLVSDFEE